MKLPIGRIARFVLKHIVLPALGKAIADRSNPLTKDRAQDILAEAVQREVGKRIAAGRA